MEKPDYSYPLACLFSLVPEETVPEECILIRSAAACTAEYCYQEFGLRLAGIRIDDVRSDSLQASEAAPEKTAPEWAVIFMVEVPGYYDPGVLLGTGATAPPDGVLEMFHTKFFTNLRELDAHLAEMTVISLRAHIQDDVTFIITP